MEKVMLYTSIILTFPIIFCILFVKDKPKQPPNFAQVNFFKKFSLKIFL